MKEMDCLVFEKDGLQVILLYPYGDLSGSEAMQKAIEAIQEEN